MSLLSLNFELMTHFKWVLSLTIELSKSFLVSFESEYWVLTHDSTQNSNSDFFSSHVWLPVFPLQFLQHHHHKCLFELLSKISIESISSSSLKFFIINFSFICFPFNDIFRPFLQFPFKKGLILCLREVSIIRGNWERENRLSKIEI